MAASCEIQYMMGHPFPPFCRLHGVAFLASNVIPIYPVRHGKGLQPLTGKGSMVIALLASRVSYSPSPVPWTSFDGFEGTVLDSQHGNRGLDGWRVADQQQSESEEAPHPLFTRARNNPFV